MRTCFLILAVFLMEVLLAAAQEAPPAPMPQKKSDAPTHSVPVDYSHAKRSFPDFAAPYVGRTVAPPTFDNSPRIETLMKDGKLMLSLNDAIALALENNLDLAIARYNLQIADTDILRTKAGAAARGVASGLVQGTPGGGIGGFGSGAPGAGAGGTSGGAGGAGSGAGGIVQSTIGTGAPVESFDPTLTGDMSIRHSAIPLSNTVTTGTAAFLQNTTLANFGYTQAFASGTSFDVGIDNTRQATNSLFNTFEPVLNSAFRVTLRQRLLSGFGFESNLRFIYIARNNREISDIAFRNQVIATVTQIQNIYWDLVDAAEDARVKERSLALAQKTLDDAQKQVKLEAIAPIEVTRAESEVDARNQDLIVAQTQLQLQQLLMKNAITRDLSDAMLSAAEVIPTDTMAIPENEPVVPTQDLIAEALQGRPELSQARIDLTNREISRKAARNALLPAVDLVASYGGAGLGGVQNVNLNPPPNPPIPSTGITDVLRQTFNGSSPDYSVGVSMTIPLRNRAAQADQVRSELEYNQAQLHLKQLQNQIRIEVKNAQFEVQQNRARVEAARKARDLARRTFDIEQKKLALGASTSLQLLQVGRDLAIAESTLVAASTAYQKSRVELDRSIGATLERIGIRISDAESGVVTSNPNIPGLAPRTE